MLDTSNPQIIDTTGQPGRFVTIHVLRPLVGVNLNAGSDGAPKQINVGGANRMRVSSQALKRAMRTWSQQFVDDNETGTRTRLLPTHIADKLAELGHDRDDALMTVDALLTITGFTVTVDTPDRTNETVFVAATTADTLTRLIHDRWDDLADARTAFATNVAAHAAAQAESGDTGKARKTAAQKKAEKAANAITPALVPADVRSAAAAAFTAGACLDIALYGRMLTALPTESVYGAASVSHAYTVDPMVRTSDSWTVVDDWQDGGFGAAHFADGKDARILGSGLLYEWACLDRDQLLTNLGGDTDAAADAERLFVSAVTWAIPAAAKHNTGSMTPPSFVVAVTGDTQPVTLPVYTEPVTGDNTLRQAADRAATYLTRINTFMPAGGGVALWLGDGDAPTLPDTITYK